jgi:hypothetical protein
MRGATAEYRKFLRAAWRRKNSEERQTERMSGENIQREIAESEGRSNMWF